jgi:hypothetical protein
MGPAPWFRTISSRAVLTLAMASLVGAGCSVLIDQNRVQCLTNEDCTDHGGEFATDSVCIQTVCRPNPTWACLADDLPAPAPAESRKATVTLHIRDLVTDLPTPGVTAQVCLKLDVGCSQPVMRNVQGDQDGNVALQLDVGFDGYIELSTKDTMPGLYFFYPPIDGDRDVPLVPLFPPVELSKLAALNAKAVMPDRGHLIVGVYDCQHQPAAGVTLSTPDGDAATSSFYVLQKIPTATALATDLSGRGGFINLRAGQVAVVGDLADGRRVGSANVFVRPGSVTYTSLVPTSGKEP